MGLTGSLQYSKWGDTKRTDSDSDDATSNNRMIARALNNARPSLAQRLFNLFSLSHNFSSFSHDAWIPQDIEAGTQAGYDSLENVHDVVHTLVGGGRGHMSHVAVAAFDPIFFWHHVNIDRLFSMWQVLNPDSWVPPTPAVLPSFTTRRGDVQTGQTPLTPFFIDNSGANFWTADSARDPLVFGYTYPELSGVPLAERSSRVRSQVIESINANYGTFSPSRLSNTSPRRTTAASESPRTRQSGEEQPEPVAGMEAEARRRNVASRSARTGNEHQLSDRALGMVGIAWTGKGGGRQPTRKSVLFDDDDDDSGSSGGSSSGSARVVRPKNSIAYREWAINVVADKSALGGPFTIFFFVGEPPSIPSPDSRPMSDRAFAALTDAPNLVGNFAAFTMSGSQMDVINRATEIATNATSRRQQVSGSVPLTWALMRLVTDPPASSKASGLERLASLREGHVRPFLRRHLTFRVLRTTDGVVVDPAAAVGMEAGGGGGGPDRERSGQQAWLTISVVGWVVRPPRDAQLELPRWGKMVDRWDLY